MHAILIINRAGSLIFHREYGSAPTSLTPNEYLILAGTIHGVHAISTQISPLPGSSGIQCLEASTFNMHILQTRTGVKFVLFTDKKNTNVLPHLQKYYELYADYVLKNPFYTLEMPIKCQIFEEQLKRYIDSH
ncbi:TRAPP complex subunit Trs23 [Schizosaccharomyces cryophilus OY26]|uniref:Trafficking protein particle complex subunit n=1 Tax=Schizosaccharomyces cryophilus (strain OY26 / ATCC MYA-4695 / CBS 11777 / NBRC 106824 / NRRL Y48691) TaxID=653667 RepID=S9W4U8_SCHCR|nr:TRAPP complex subunit Trs23 [Schizosaccharomyces cryophilus OY26]EPY53554.1 TRAPP complex subunit Trs23 [Schizosaccharomyces cryophilus OY26]